DSGPVSAWITGLSRLPRSAQQCSERGAQAMISSDSSVRESVAEHRRRLVAETCPDENSSWIAQQVSLAVRGVAQAGSQAGRQHSTPRPGDTGNVLTSGRTRRALRVACLVVTGLAAVVIATAGRRWFILATVGRGG